MSLLTPDIGLLFWMTFSFGIVFFILARFGFPVILKAVKKRTAYISRSLEAAEEANVKLASVNKQAEAIIAGANEQRARILSEAGELRNRILSDAKERAEEDVRIRMNKATAELEELRRKALGDIRKEIAEISIRIAEKVVDEEMKTSGKQQRIIEHLLNEEIISNN